jgi:hypothetical protein
VDPKTFSVNVQALPAGTIKEESLNESDVARINEPGLVAFHLIKGWSYVYHWSRDLSYYGGTLVSGEFTVIVRGGTETGSLIFSQGGGTAYRVVGGEPLWAGRDGAVFLITQKDRYGLLLTDSEFRPVRSAVVSVDFRYSDHWQRLSNGTFRFQLHTPELAYSLNFQAGTVSALPAAPYRLEQRDLLESDCGGGTGSQLKIFQGDQVQYSLLDAVAPRDPRFFGSPVFADGKSAVISTSSGPAVLNLADGTMKAAPELKALGSPYMLADPSSSVTVAAIPLQQPDGSYRLRVGYVGMKTLDRDWTFKPGKAPSGTELRIKSDSYFDGPYLQVAVSYPPEGGHCGGADSAATFLGPVLVKGDWKGSLQVRVKSPVSLLAINGWTLGAPLRTVSAQTVFTAKRIVSTNSAYYLVVALPEGEGALRVDPNSLEWVQPSN